MTNGSPALAYDPTLEKNILSLMVTDPDQLEFFSRLIGPWHFFDPGNQLWAEEIFWLKDNSQPIGGEEVRDRLMREAKFDRAGGITRMAEIFAASSSKSQSKKYVKKLIDLYLKRTTISKLSSLTRDIEDDVITPESAPGALQQTIERIAPPKEDADIQSSATLSMIEDWEFNDSDNWFGDNLIEPGKNITFIGPGGVGKSRMLLQFACYAACGIPFMNQNTHAMRGKKWYFFQTENSSARIKSDLTKIVSSLLMESKERLTKSGSEYDPIADRLRIKTIINDCVIISYQVVAADSSMRFDSASSVARMQRTLAHFNPDFVVFDPLSDKASGDLNKDEYMIIACQQMELIARTSNPSRVLFCVHHSLTGKAGAAKAVGWDSSSYGRGSKALLGWTRTQFNVSPATEDGDGELIIACGKNSNGKKFEPYGIYYDSPSGIYQFNADFNLDEYKEEVGIKSKKVSTPKKVFDAMQSIPYSKQALCEHLMEEFHLAQRTAYEWIEKADLGKAIYFKNEVYCKSKYFGK